MRDWRRLPYWQTTVSVARSVEELHRLLDRYGVTASFFTLNKLTARRGRLLTDLDKDRYFCVIGSEVEQSLKKLGHAEALG
jgi:peptidoglycan/xylan/chitin deacetylase (PgdA/CDA1 family)